MTAASDRLTLFLCGDVMTGRGVDQVLPRPGSPVLYEPLVQDARAYVKLAEALNGSIARPSDFSYPWGEALQEMLPPTADARIINLETSITSSDQPWPNKLIHYRMHPANIGVLVAARIDCSCLANNHVLDWGSVGLAETLHTLEQAGIVHTGAGACEAEARAPASVEPPGKGRVLVFSFGSITSGIPPEWQAGADRPGVNLLPDLTEHTALSVATQMRALRQPGDIILVSIHWGDNWGYEVPDEQVRFAHRLIDEGVDLVHGHSSHHVKLCEVYRERLVLYGCGDFLDDYEGISGYEHFRPDLRLAYLVQLEPGCGRLLAAQLVPLQIRRFRLNRASSADAVWLCDLLNELCARLGIRVELGPVATLQLQWTQQRA